MLSLLLVFATLALTRSATSSVLTVIVGTFGVRLWFRSPEMRLMHNAALAAVLLTVVFSLLFWPDEILLTLGRDPTLTGRIPLWEELFGSIAAQPFLGFGYSGFWNADSRRVQYLWQVITWNAPNAHNGYIDLILQLGIVGLLLYLYVFWSILKQAVEHLRQETLPEASWILLFMTCFLLLNLDEGPLPYIDEFMLFTVASLLVVSAVPKQKSFPS
jgi:O-antigen ligase